MNTDTKWTKDCIEAEKRGKRVGAWGHPQFTGRWVSGTVEEVARLVYPADVHTPRHPRGVRNPLI